MRTVRRRIADAFGLIGEVFDELSHAEEAWKACGLGESMREAIDEAIRTYKREVEKLERAYM